MYVPTGETNNVVIIDLQRDTIIGRIAELENAHGLAASPNSDFLVAGSMLQQESGEARRAAKPANVGEAEHQAHHPADDSAQTPTTSPSYVSIIHPEHGRVLRRIAVRALTHHMAVSPDGKIAVAVHSGAGGISVIDLDKMNVVTAVQTGAGPNYAVFSRDGKRLYISNARPGTVSEIDTRAWSVKREFAVGKEPEHIVLNADGTRLFSTNVAEGTVAEVELKSGTVVKRYAVGAQPHGIDVSADGRWLFVSSKGDNKLVRIDLSNDEQRVLDLQPAPYHLDYVDSVGKLYVSSRMAPRIWVVGAQAMTIRGEIDLGQGVAHQMVILDK